MIDSVAANEGVDRALVEACIARKDRCLKFVPALEALFEKETGPRRCRSLARTGLVGVGVMQLLLLPLWLLIGDVYTQLLWVQLGVVTPLSLVLLGIVLRQPPPFVRELCIVLVTLLGVTGVTVVALDSVSPDRWVIPQLYAVPFLYIAAMQRLRFVATLIACTLMLLLAHLLMAGLPQYRGGVYAASMLILAGSAGLALWGTYTSERQGRSAYLYSLLTRLQNGELDRMSRFDPLTGLGNRRLLDEVVQECQRSGQVSHLAMIMLDLDHFKKLNDALGHLAGDHCLVRIGGLVQGSLRDHRDHAFRYGGEEFLVVLQDASRETATAVAERIRAAVEAAGIPIPGPGGGSVVTASLGVSIGALGSSADAERLVAEADAALYAAKRAGRNRVVWHRS